MDFHSREASYSIQIAYFRKFYAIVPWRPSFDSIMRAKKLGCGKTAKYPPCTHPRQEVGRTPSKKRRRGWSRRLQKHVSIFLVEERTYLVGITRYVA